MLISNGEREEAIIALYNNGGDVGRMLRVYVINRAWQGEEKIRWRRQEKCSRYRAVTIRERYSENIRNLPTKGGSKASETDLTSTRGFSSGTRQSNGRI